MKRKNDTLFDYYDELPKAYIDGKYINGKFYDTSSNEEIQLMDNAVVRIVLYRKDLLDKDYGKHIEVNEKKILESGSNLFFQFQYDNNKFLFTVMLEEDLISRKKGNQFSRLGSCDCKIIELSRNGIIDGNFKLIEADSLNQAFTFASIKYRPDNRSHTTNVFKSYFDINGYSLEKYRI